MKKTLFQTQMLEDEQLRETVIRTLTKKSADIDYEKAEEYVAEAALRILASHHRQAIELTGKMLNYWLTAAFYVFLDERRRGQSQAALQPFAGDENEEELLARIPGEARYEPEESLRLKTKAEAMSRIGQIIAGLKGNCRRVLTLYTQEKSDSLTQSPHQILGISRDAYYVRVSRCKGKLKAHLLQLPWFQEHRDLLLS